MWDSVFRAKHPVEAAQTEVEWPGGERRGATCPDSGSLLCLFLFSPRTEPPCELDSLSILLRSQIATVNSFTSAQDTSDPV